MQAALYQCFLSKYQLRREEIPNRLEVFHQALQNFGVGAKIIERLVAKSLYTRLGLNFTEHVDWALIDYVNASAQATRRSAPES